MCLESDIKEIGRTLYAEGNFPYGVSIKSLPSMALTIFQDVLPPYRVAVIESYKGSLIKRLKIW